MEKYWESGGIAPLILLPRHEMEVSGQLHAPAAVAKNPITDPARTRTSVVKLVA
jgi:hypothetical protein